MGDLEKKYNNLMLVDKKLILRVAKHIFLFELVSWYNSWSFQLKGVNNYVLPMNFYQFKGSNNNFKIRINFKCVEIDKGIKRDSNLMNKQTGYPENASFFSEFHIAEGSWIKALGCLVFAVIKVFF